MQRRLDTEIRGSFSFWKTTGTALNVCWMNCTLNFLFFQLEVIKKMKPLTQPC